MRLLISTVFVAACAVSGALADGVSNSDVAAAKGGHRVPQAHSKHTETPKTDSAVPQHQSSVVVSLERGVRVWRPIVDASDSDGAFIAWQPRSSSSDTQGNGYGYYNGGYGGGYSGGYVGGGFIGGGFIEGGLGNGGAFSQNIERNGAGVGRPAFADNRKAKENHQPIARAPHQRVNIERGYDRVGRYEHGQRPMPQVHHLAQARTMPPRHMGPRTMGPGPQMVRPHIARPHMAPRPMVMARPHVQMGGPRMMMGGPRMHGPRMHGPRPMARPMARMGGGRRH